KENLLHGPDRHLLARLAAQYGCMGRPNTARALSPGCALRAGHRGAGTRVVQAPSLSWPFGSLADIAAAIPKVRFTLEKMRDVTKQLQKTCAKSGGSMTVRRHDR